jgi:hypothetical protein
VLLQMAAANLIFADTCLAANVDALLSADPNELTADEAAAAGLLMKLYPGAEVHDKRKPKAKKAPVARKPKMARAFASTQGVPAATA